MKLYKVTIDLLHMIVEASDYEHAKRVAAEHIEDHIKRIGNPKMWPKEICGETEVTLTEMKSAPYGCQTNKSVGRILMETAHDA
jgi:hypothetical protein